MINDCKNTFSEARFYSMHGLTEAFRSTYLDPSQVQIRPDSIGKPIADVELYVINEEGKVIHKFDSQLSPKKHIQESLDILQKQG